jgi:hypothetical protein
MGSLDDDFAIENDENGGDSRQREQKMKMSTAVDVS